MPLLWSLGHEVGETLELTFVILTFLGSLGILVALGHWWQR